MAYDLPPIADTPRPPYYAALFTSVRTGVDAEEYAAAGEQMLAIAKTQPGYLGVETVRDAAGMGITISYWESREAIAAWKQHADHLRAQAAGKTRWYAEYRLRIARVESDYGMTSSDDRE
jgi:heme-degrading monooxygenase HmoA